MVYGDAGVGKTHFALQATPNKTLMFDAESGADMFEGRKGFEFDYWVDDDGLKTASIRELEKAIEYLRTAEGRKLYDTFIIDPISDIWDNIQDQRSEYKEQKREEKREFEIKKYGSTRIEDSEDRNETDLESFAMNDWGAMKRLYKGMMLKLKNLPQNVILIAREREISETKPDGSVIRTGEYTYEAEKNTKFAVDFMIRIVYDSKAKKRYAEVAKSCNEGLVIDERFDNPTFALFEKVVNNMAKGTEVMPMSEKEENVFLEEEQDKGVIEDLKTQVIAEAKSLGGSKNPVVTETMKKYVASGNPNSITDIDVLNNLLADLKAINEGEGE
jgi:hypothetical protein